MSRRTTAMMKAGLSILHYSGAGELLSPLTRGRGVIFMLHRVSPEPVGAFEPNRILRVRPDFLETVVQRVIERGFECISLDEIPARLAASESTRPFACFTFDDGYRDNREHAFPILRRYGVPHALYVPTDYPDGTGDLWWLALEEAVRRADRLDVEIAGEARSYTLSCPEDRERAYAELYWPLRDLPEPEARAIVATLARQAGFDPSGLCSGLIMSWDELREAAKDPLLTIGAHTCGHYALSKLTDSEARHELQESRRRIEAELGRPCRHFSYPYGCERAAGPRDFALAREAGFETAVTTRKGLVQRWHAEVPTALPRLSLNGDYQDSRYVDVMLSGVPFAMWNAVRRVRAAV